jgi:hypothetical protein
LNDARALTRCLFEEQDDCARPSHNGIEHVKGTYDDDPGHTVAFMTAECYDNVTRWMDSKVTYGHPRRILAFCLVSCCPAV